jgi:hypothetical protein
MIYISISINVILLGTLIFISTKVMDMYSRIEDSFDAVESFREHLDIVHNLETFYGDETLGALIEHSKELSDFLKETQEMHSLSEKEYDEYTKTEEEE